LNLDTKFCSETVLRTEAFTPVVSQLMVGCEKRHACPQASILGSELIRFMALIRAMKCEFDVCIVE